MVSIGDINLDGKSEVMVGCGDGYIYALSGETGEIKWLSRMEDWIRSVFVLAASNDHEPEVFMGSESGTIYVYGSDLTPSIDPITTPQSIRCIYAADINGDGQLEII